MLTKVRKVTNQLDRLPATTAKEKINKTTTLYLLILENSDNLKDINQIFRGLFNKVYNIREVGNEITKITKTLKETTKKLD